MTILRLFQGIYDTFHETFLKLLLNTGHKSVNSWFI